VQWEEGHEDGDDDGSFRAVSTRDRSYTPKWRSLGGFFFPKARRKRFTLEDSQVEVQAGEQEISQALEDKRILSIDGLPLNRLLALS
jgi:hypothetical protein